MDNGYMYGNGGASPWERLGYSEDIWNQFQAEQAASQWDIGIGGIDIGPFQLPPVTFTSGQKLPGSGEVPVGVITGGTQMRCPPGYTMDADGNCIPNAGTIRTAAYACPVGYRISQPRKKCGVYDPGHCVKRKKMNPLNPDALRRSTSRLLGFQKAVKRVEKALTRACGSKRRAATRATAKCGTCNKRNCVC